MPKINLDLDKPIYDLSDSADAKDGRKDTDQRLGRTLAQLLKTSTTGDALKYLVWAIDLYQTGKIEVDESDYEHLVNFIKSNTQTWALVKGQLLQEFAAAKDASKKT
ncbi:MAG: hypothetical protein ACYDH9_08200 [Limisphaerales bacterium]